MSLRKSIALAVLAVLALPASASAAPYLPVARARQSVMIYERAYWPDAQVSVGVCHRRDAVQVRCAAEVQSPDRSLVVADTVTLLAHGVVRIHPGQFAEEIILRQ